MLDFNLSVAEERYSGGPLGLARVFRSLALDVLDDRDAVLRHLDHPEFTQVYDDRDSTCVDRALLYIGHSYMKCSPMAIRGYCCPVLGHRFLA